MNNEKSTKQPDALSRIFPKTKSDPSDFIKKKFFAESEGSDLIKKTFVMKYDGSDLHKKTFLCKFTAADSHQLLQIRLTPKTFPRHEVGEGMGHEMIALVHPSGKVLLPLRNGMVRIARVAVGLCVGIDVDALVRGPRLPRSIPPVIDALVALLKIILAAYHRVEEILALESVGVDERHCTLALRYLSVRVATETDAAVVKPFDLRRMWM